MPDPLTNPTSSPASERNGSKTFSVFLGVLLLSAPLGVAMSVGYRGLFALEAWAFGSPYPPEQLEFLQPEKVLGAILWTYMICAIPVLVTASALAWRTRQTGGFSYVYAAVVASVAMAVSMAAAAYVFRHELVRVVTEDTALNGVVYAVIVSLVSAAVLRRAGLITGAE
jgi:hypothetical protein